jgi:hypothetical protein
MDSCVHPIPKAYTVSHDWLCDPANPGEHQLPPELHVSHGVNGVNGKRSKPLTLLTPCGFNRIRYLGDRAVRGPEKRRRRI